MGKRRGENHGKTIGCIAGFIPENRLSAKHPFSFAGCYEAGCDPWKTPYVVTVSHMAEMVEEIQTELLAATEELFRERREKDTHSEMC